MAIIPGRNPLALISYYLGIFAILPFVGIALGIGAVVLGVMGLKAYNRDPAIEGAGHAWVGIIAGTLFGLLWLALAAFGLIMMIAAGVG